MPSLAKLDSKERILTIAVREFSRVGYAGARMDRIAKLAKVSKGMIYYHFADKDELFASVLQFAFQREHALQESPDHPVESILFWSDFYARNREWTQLLVRESLEWSKSKVLAEEVRAQYWKTAVEKMRQKTGLGGWPEFLDPAHYLLSVIAIEIAPIILPHLARLITGKHPEGEEFAADRKAFLTAFARFVAEQGPPKPRKNS